MNRHTILKPTGCDLKRLPLGALEAFVLSQLDGRLTLEEVAEIAGLEFVEAARLAELLVGLGAASAAEARPAPTKKPTNARTKPVVIEEDARSARRDPRADVQSLRPPGRAEKRSLRPGAARPQPTRHPTPRPERRRTRKSLRVDEPSVPPNQAPVADPAVDLDKTDANVPRIATPSSAKAVTSTRKPSKAMRASSRQIQAAKRSTPAPVKTNPESRHASKPSLPRTTSSDRRRQLATAAREINVQARVELLLKAAEEALKRDDASAAANNYRLALGHREDLHVRMKLEEVDGRARTQRFEKQLTLARVAERSQRSADAAIHFARAHEARPDAAVAERAAYHLRVSGGDLERAAALAERAVALDSKVAAHHITLAEIYVAAGRLVDAEKAAAAALAIAPKDERAKDLASAIAHEKKAKNK